MDDPVSWWWANHTARRDRKRQHKQLWRLVKNSSENIAKFLSGHVHIWSTPPHRQQTTADAQTLCTQCGCYLAFHPPGMHTNAHTVAHAWANTHTHTCTLMFIYLEINEGFHPLIRSIKSSCQRGHAVIIVQRMMVMCTWFCPWHWNVKHVKNLQTDATFQYSVTVVGLVVCQYYNCLSKSSNATI